MDQQLAAMTLDVASELVHYIPPFQRRRRIGLDLSLVIPERGQKLIAREHSKLQSEVRRNASAKDPATSGSAALGLCSRGVGTREVTPRRDWSERSRTPGHR